MAKLIHVDGTESELKPEGKTFSLEELQHAVGGYIELVGTRDGKQMYINEEGKLRGLPVNVAATRLTNLERVGDFIVGPALVCEPGEVR